MKKTILFLGILLQAASAFAQLPKINYVVAIAKFQKFYNEQNADSLYAMYSVQMKAALPIEKTKDFFKGWHNQYGALKSTSIVKESAANTIYKGVFEKTELYIVFPLNEKNELSGLFIQPVKQEAASDTAKLVSNFNIKTSAGADIFGTLNVPENIKGKIPVVLIIAGSGPTDRNCNQPGLHTNAYQMLSDALSVKGIASLRYDKRGAGASAGAIKSESEIRFEDMVTDAVTYIKKLKSDGRFSKIYIIGHSEGSLVGMIAANEEAVDGFISIAGAGESADLILKRQLNAQSEYIAKKAEPLLLSLKNGKVTKNATPELDMLFRSSVQPYLISWFKYDPQTEIKKLKIPTLILQGTTDLQVSVADAEKLQKANPNTKMILIENMNHVLKHTTLDHEENMATYNNPTLPLDETLISSICSFIIGK
jgi:uncharacterized protein